LVVSTGSFIEGHLPPGTFDDMIAVIKKEGGYLIFTIKTSCYEALGFKDKLEGLVKEGKITLVKQYSWNKYEGMEKYKGLGIFQPDISHLLAFKVNK